MSSEFPADGGHLHTYCKRCGYRFERPRASGLCNERTACDKRLKDPTYRVPAGRLAAVEERVRQYLISSARRVDPEHPFTATVTYGNLCKAIDPDQRYWVHPRFRGIGKVLGRISSFEHENGRPMLSALVVHKADYQAGDGFATLGRQLGYQVQPGQELSFWRGQVEAVVRYWTALAKDAEEPTPTERAFALLASISEDLQEVRRLLGAI